MTSNDCDEQIEKIKKELTQKLITFYGTLSSDDLNKFAAFLKIKKYNLRIKKNYIELYDYYKNSLDTGVGCDNLLTMSYLFSVNPRLITDYKGYYEIISQTFNKLLVGEYHYNYYLFMDYRILHVLRFYKGNKDEIISYMVSKYKNQNIKSLDINKIVFDLNGYSMRRKQDENRRF